MKQHASPFSVRILGFSAYEISLFDATFAAQQNRPYRYFYLPIDNIQEPDIRLVNAGDLKTLATLADWGVDDIRPILLVGKTTINLPYLSIAQPVHRLSLFEALDRLMAKRIAALTRENPGEKGFLGIASERRRRTRLDLDVTDPREFTLMRAKPAKANRILVIDDQSTFRDALLHALEHYPVPVEWVRDAISAAEIYAQQHVSIVLINPCLPDLDPYRMCREIKAQRPATRITVILLIDETFSYDRELAAQVHCDGFLNRHMAQSQLLPVLWKFLSLTL